MNVPASSRAGSLPQGFCEHQRLKVGASLLAKTARQTPTHLQQKQKRQPQWAAVLFTPYRSIKPDAKAFPWLRSSARRHPRSPPR
ncbi:hypothetical protein EAH74_15555 [Pseudomonas mandelii]|uniref:Uncharacterized protein n=1 Tax=Pseudomonas mandelii TaxID=75612 RepID=A0A502ICD9_9PSED|nr:hypothetical protein EAH74_15555 [Pseudomonas mandelii]